MLRPAKSAVPVDDARNELPPLRDVRFWSLFALVAVGAIVLVIGVAPQLSQLGHVGAAFWVIVGLLVLLDMRPLFTAGLHDTSGLTTSQMFVFALLLHWGLGAAILGQVLGVLVDHLLNRKALWRAAFNMAQYALCLGATQFVLGLFGHAASPLHPDRLDASILPSLAAGAAAWFLVNSLLIGLIIAFKDHRPWRQEIFDEFDIQVIYIGAMISLAPLVVLAAERSAWLVPLLLVPLLALYRNGAVSLEAEHKSLHDALTGLPNRKLVLLRTDDAIEAATAGGHVAALFMLDLDRFKEVNDTLGHHVGDLLLQQVAERLVAAVRPEDLVARLGGDEFAILLPKVADGTAAEHVAQRISDALALPFVLQGMNLEVGASMGIALAPEQAGDTDALMQRADVAMYVAKEGGLVYQTYSAAIDRNSTERLAIMADLRRALEGQRGGGRLALHYQPQIDLTSGEVVGVEALIRWQHPIRGMVPPDQFVPLAEQTSLMRPLTRWVFAQAVAQLGVWHAEGLPLRMSVNVCARDLHSQELVDYLANLLCEHQVTSNYLQIELTESMLVSDTGRVRSTLVALDRLGLQISLDDFGTGYSSLAHLRRLPVNEIKVDRSFVLGMVDDEDDRTMVRSIIELASALGLRVVAEGVETARMAAELTELGCAEGQGWHWSKARPAEELTAWLRAAVAPPRLTVVTGAPTARRSSA